MSNPYKVNFVLLVPQGVTLRPLGPLQTFAQHVQCWYRSQMAGLFKTFEIGNVYSLQSTHPPEWYMTPVPGETDPHYYFWDNALNDLATFGIGFGQPFDDWVCFVDAAQTPGSGQILGGASTGYNGVAIMDEYGLSHTWALDCGTGFGGSAHELGHTFGLAHDFTNTHNLMGGGYIFYPNAVLTSAEIAQLNGNPWFSVQRFKPAPLGVCPFAGGDIPRPKPVPNPRPTP